ncbi:hypothetical protein N0575_14355 [Pseudomonas aeruginosa]|nr:hypothetical protein [Pseudomonas aeruginosa]MCT1211166.1 hypothetical protein [Pseudomonas aeruginosa]
MNVTFTYSYNHSIVPPRCRLPRTVREHDGLITVEIREIPPEQAPVAIISRNTSDQGHDPVEYRTFEGCLWTNCKLFAGARDNKAEGGPNATHRMPEPEISLVTESVTLSHWEQGIYIGAYQGKAGIGEYLERWARDRIIIDGQLFLPVGEPMYVVMTFGLSNNHGGTSLHCTDFLNANIKDSSYFSILEIDQALEYARQVAANRGDTIKFSVDPGFEFQVLIPKAVQWKNPGLSVAA